MLGKPSGRWRLCWAIAGFVSLVATGGCGVVGKPFSPPPPPPTEIAIGITSEPQTLNPIFAEDRSSLAVCHALYNSIESEGPGGVLQPELADKVTVSEDGKTYTLHLRPGVKWHDGRPLTAQDVLFTYEAILDPQVDSPYRPLFLVDGKRPQMRAVDENTVEIQLPHPSAGFANALTVGILPKHAFSKVEDIKNPHYFNEHPIGTGPFVFYQWKGGQSIELKRFDDYFAGKPGVDKLIYRVVPESGLQAAFSNGTIDVFVPTATDIQKLRENQSPDRPSLFSYPSGSVVTLLLHGRGSPLADRAVRKALALVIDRKEISVKGWGGPDLAEPANSLFPPGNWAHGDTPPHGPDLAAAQKLLDEAGYTTSASGLRVKDGKVLSLQLLYVGDRTMERIAQTLAEQAAAIGIQVHPKAVDRTTFYQILDSPQKNFDLALNTYLLGPDPDAFADLVTSQGGYNFQEYDNPRVDQLFKQARETQDQAVRRTLYAQIDQALQEDVPLLPLVYPKGYLAVRSTVVNVNEAIPEKVVYFRHPERLGVNPTRAPSR